MSDPFGFQTTQISLSGESAGETAKHIAIWHKRCIKT